MRISNFGIFPFKCRTCGDGFWLEHKHRKQLHHPLTGQPVWQNQCSACYATEKLNKPQPTGLTGSAAADYTTFVQELTQATQMLQQ